MNPVVKPPPPTICGMINSASVGGGKSGNNGIELNSKSNLTKSFLDRLR
jgi:hypothetical protein